VVRGNYHPYLHSPELSAYNAWPAQSATPQAGIVASCNAHQHSQFSNISLDQAANLTAAKQPHPRHPTASCSLNRNLTTSLFTASLPLQPVCRARTPAVQTIPTAILHHPCCTLIVHDVFAGTRQHPVPAPRALVAIFQKPALHVMYHPQLGASGCTHAYHTTPSLYTTFSARAYQPDAKAETNVLFQARKSACRLRLPPAACQASLL
jgi:hypothetical protein